MDVSSKNPIFTRDALAVILDALYGSTVGTTPVILGMKLHLYTAALSPPSPISVETDFTEAVYPGYLATNLPTRVGPFNLPNGLGSGMEGFLSFLAGAITTPQLILGYWVESPSLSPAVLMSEQFQTPISIVNPGDLLDVHVILPMLFRVNTGA